MIDNYDCCPFKSTPGRFNGQWTNCIHGLMGLREEILRKLRTTELQIAEWEADHRTWGDASDLIDRPINTEPYQCWHRYPKSNGQGFPVNQCLDCGYWKS